MHLAAHQPEDDSGQRPSDEPPPEVHEAPERQPIVGVYTGGAFFTKQAGRWQRLPGGPGHEDDGLAEGRDREDGN